MAERHRGSDDLPGVGAEIVVELLEGGAGHTPALEVALAAALLEAVAEGRRGPLVRVYRPPPTVAFGRRDSLLDGFARAARMARRAGFTPVIRAPGGRVAAYHEDCLVFDEIVPADDAMSGIKDRFAVEAGRHAAALRSLGIDARVGQVPGEYCPGAFTVNARAEIKLIGAAQRVLRGAWLLSTVVVVGRAAPIRAVLEDVHAALEIDWAPATVGAITDELPRLGIDDVCGALLDGYRSRYRLRPGRIAPEDEADAIARVGRHTVAR